MFDVYGKLCRVLCFRIKEYKILECIALSAYTCSSFAEREPAPGAPPELTLAVSGALNRLSPEQREAVVLKIYQGFKFEEMAEILACPVSTVKSRLYTALDLMKQQADTLVAQLYNDYCHDGIK